MMRILLASLVLLAQAGASAPQRLPVGKLAVAQSTSLGEIDTDRLKGQPARLAWSPDGTELYLQMLDGAFGKPEAVTRHYVFTLADGKRRDLDSEPAWAATYWRKKSAQGSPDAPTFKIGIETGTRVERAISAPMGGDLARGGTGSGGDVGGGAGGTTAADAIANAANAQTVTVHAMKLGGQVIGEFINSVIVPGLTFGWGPQGTGVIAYATVKGGKLVIMDMDGARQEVDGTKDALLPAWTDDGRKIAWLRKDGRKKYSLLVANVTAR